jgi:orotate phosphoribosyltransferase
MTPKDETAHNIAEFLLQIKAIKLQPSQPFTWASGWKSPIYCDNRISLSHPKVRTYIRQALAKLIEDKFGKPEVIAGVATAAIAQGALVAEAMGLPFVYVRSSPKDHGRENLIEGEVLPKQSVVVIEDLVSTGKSSLQAVNALRDSGCEVKGMVSIFTYGLKTATDNFKKDKCRLYSLCNYDVLVEKAVETNYVTEKELKTLKSWRDAPENWGK